MLVDILYMVKSNINLISSSFRAQDGGLCLYLFYSHSIPSTYLYFKNKYVCTVSAIPKEHNYIGLYLLYLSICFTWPNVKSF